MVVSLQPAISAQATGAYWPPLISNGIRAAIWQMPLFDRRRMSAARMMRRTRGHRRKRNQRQREAAPQNARHNAASTRVSERFPVPTSFQFGSREVVSRANVQTSVISVTLSGLPSTIVPALSRVTEIICDTKRTVSCAALCRGFGTDQFGLVDRHEAGFGLLLVSFAILDHVSKLSNTSEDNKSFSARRSPLANASTIIS